LWRDHAEGVDGVTKVDSARIILAQCLVIRPMIFRAVRDQRRLGAARATASPEGSLTMATNGARFDLRDGRLA
jgi:hypothetical protein